MQLHFSIHLIIYVFLVILASFTTLYFTRKDIKVFESSRDRDGTILLLLLFAALFYTQALFAEQMSSEMVANIIGNITGGILTACAFVYKDKDRQKGDKE